MKGRFDGVEIVLPPGAFRFAEGNTRIRTLLGSCVAIIFWHPTRRMGAMCHYLLASRPQGREKGLDGRYGEDALLMFLQEAWRRGTDPTDYVVKMVGGGNMFPAHSGQWPCRDAPCPEVIDTCRNVACRNVQIGRALLDRHRIPVIAEHLGGSGHRNVIFDIATGDVWVRYNPLCAEGMPCPSKSS